MVILHAAETIKGGVATYLNNVVLWQADSDEVEKVLLVVPKSHMHELSPVLLDHGKVLVTPFSGSSRLGKVLALYNVLRRVKKGKSLTIAHLHSTFAGLVGRLPGVFSGNTKIAYQPHGVSYDPNRSGRVPRVILLLIEKLFVGNLRCIVAISDYEKRVISGADMRLPVHVIKNTVVDKAVSVANSDPGKGYYLFVGRLDHQKGFDLLYRFWKNTERRLLVVGEQVLGDSNAYPETPSISFKGWVANTDIDSYYAGARALIVPSRWEGFGLVVLEAYRNGTPVICSDRGALPELVTDGENGFVFDMDCFDETLENALSNLESMDERQLSHQCRYCFENLYSRDKMNTSLMSLYRSLQTEGVHEY